MNDESANAGLIQPVDADRTMDDLADRTQDGLQIQVKYDDDDFIESDRGIKSPKQGMNERKPNQSPLRDRTESKVVSARSPRFDRDNGDQIINDVSRV